MQKYISILLCILILGSLLSACSSSAVSISVDSQYENSLADEIAAEKETDDEGNIVYKFSKDQYLEYAKKLMEQVKTEFREVLSDTATYSYLNEDGTELVVGIEKDLYDEEKCKAQAEKVGKIALLYNASVLDSTGKVTVSYENCFTGEEFFKSEIAI